MDPQGAALSGARVNLRSIATGVPREAVADGRGTFVLTDLAPGSYVVRVQANAFAGVPADHRSSTMDMYSTG